MEVKIRDDRLYKENRLCFILMIIVSQLGKLQRDFIDQHIQIAVILERSWKFADTYRHSGVANRH